MRPVRPWSTARGAALISLPLLAFGLAVFASGLLLVVPTYTGVRAPHPSRAASAAALDHRRPRTGGREPRRWGRARRYPRGRAPGPFRAGRTGLTGLALLRPESQ